MLGTHAAAGVAVFRLFPRWFTPRLTHGPPTVHFVTWRLSPEQRPLTAAERSIVCGSLRRRDGKGYRMLAFVVMDDHVHVLVEPRSVPLERLTQSWRSFTAHEIRRLHRREGRVWQAECAQRAIAGAEDLREAVEYIVGNPWKRWPFVERYPWVWEASREARAWRPEKTGLAGSIGRVMAAVRH